MAEGRRYEWTPYGTIAAEVRAGLYRAVDHALDHGWRPQDIDGILRGPARYEDGLPVGCCTVCGKPEWLDGLILTPCADGVMGDGMCPQCRSVR